MSKYIVVAFPLIVLMMALVSAGLLLWQRFSSIDIDSYFASFRREISAEIQAPITASDVRETLQMYRWQQGLSDYTADDLFCEHIYQDSPEFDRLTAIPCENCRSAGLLQLPKDVPTKQLLSVLRADEQALELLDSETITNVCVSETDSLVSVFFAERVDERVEVARIADEQSAAVSERSREHIKNFTEAELWEALQTYRDSHNVRKLELSEDVCRYARKRVQDHLDDFGTRPKEEYPRQDKYPLDAHEGFSLDAESGYVFEVTGKRAIAENLAYWPDADYPNRVIEWGWDTSTEGHREAQLSEQYAFGCLTGQDGFYVAIFAD